VGILGSSIVGMDYLYRAVEPEFSRNSEMGSVPRIIRKTNGLQYRHSTTNI
jgi:hypothetical protein